MEVPFTEQGAEGVGILGLLDAARPGDAQAIGGRGWHGTGEETRLVAPLKPHENRAVGGYGRDGLAPGMSSQLRSVAAENRERIAMAALHKHLDCRGVQWRHAGGRRAIPRRGAAGRSRHCLAVPYCPTTGRGIIRWRHRRYFPCRHASSRRASRSRPRNGTKSQPGRFAIS